MPPDHSFFRKIAPWLLASLWVAGAGAGIDSPTASPGSMPAPTAPVVAERPAGHLARPASPPRDAGRILRCWQYGRLIFEEPVGTLPPNLASQGYRFGSRNSQGSIQLLDIHTATCTVR